MVTGLLADLRGPVALREVKALLSSAHADVEAVKDALAAAEEADPEDPATEDPAVGDPVTDPATV